MLVVRCVNRSSVSPYVNQIANLFVCVKICVAGPPKTSKSVYIYAFGSFLEVPKPAQMKNGKRRNGKH